MVLLVLVCAHYAVYIFYGYEKKPTNHALDNMLISLNSCY